MPSGDDAQSKTETSSSFSSIDSHCDAKSKGSEGEQDKAKWSRQEGLTAVFDGLVAIATVFAVVIYFFQLSESKMQRSTDISVHRPYLAPDNLQLEIFPDGHQVITQEWKHFGSTPPNGMKIEWTWQQELPESRKAFSEATYKQTLSGPTAPNGGSIHDESPISNTDLNRGLQSGHIFAFGDLEYHDFFPGNESQTHLVEYCADMSHFKKSKDGRVGWSLVGVCRVHNCFDEECGDDYYKLNSHERK